MVVSGFVSVLCSTAAVVPSLCSLKNTNTFECNEREIKNYISSIDWSYLVV